MCNNCVYACVCVRARVCIERTPTGREEERVGEKVVGIEGGSNGRRMGGEVERGRGESEGRRRLGGRHRRCQDFCLGAASFC